MRGTLSENSLSGHSFSTKALSDVGAGSSTQQLRGRGVGIEHGGIDILGSSRRMRGRTSPKLASGRFRNGKCRRDSLRTLNPGVKVAARSRLDDSKRRLQATDLRAGVAG